MSMENRPEKENLEKKNFILRPLKDEIYESYSIYAISTLNRSLPSLIDGMKIVQRRILYSMWVYNHRKTDKLSKSIGICGKVSTYFHPHGEMSIYAAFVRLARDFVLLHPLVESQGNFGSVDGDEAAAARYTEGRLSNISHLLLEEIHEDTTEFQANYDGTNKEPMYLVPQFPIILVNGSQGIAVGFSSNIPTHNLGEVIDGTILLINNPEASLKEIMTHIQGPDFPTSGIVSNKKQLYEAYESGEGMINIRGVAEFEGDDKIIITEIPYQLQKSTLVAKIIEEVKKGTMDGISSVRDESSSKIRIVIELKKKVQKEVVINQLYKFTQLSSSFKINLLAINIHGEPTVFGLKEILTEFIKFRHSTIIRKTSFRLEEAHKKIETLFGFMLALDNSQELLSRIGDSDDIASLKENFLGQKWTSKSLHKYLLKNNENPPKEFRFSENQIENIFNSKVTKFSKMEASKIAEDIDKETNNIIEYRKIINNKELRDEIIKAQLEVIKKKFAVNRKTIIEDNTYDFEDEDFIPKETVVITLSADGFLKRVPLESYRAQRRGGKGSSGFQNNNNKDDFILQVLTANTHDKLLIFTSNGKVYSFKSHQIPESGKNTKGRFVLNCIDLDENDKIIKILPFASNEESEIIFATNHGTIRKNNIKDFEDLRKNGKIYMKILPEDNIKIIDVVYVKPTDEVMLFTKFGKAIRFNVNDLRTFNSRSSIGVRGCKLDEKDEVISMISLEEVEIKSKFILTITSNGLAKMTKPENYRKTNRGTKGVGNVKLVKKNYVVKVLLVTKNQTEESDNILVVTQDGQVINCSVNSIPTVGRVSQGVKVVTLNDNDFIVAANNV